MKTKLLITVLILSAKVLYTQESNAQGINEDYDHKLSSNKTIGYMAIINNYSSTDDRFLLNGNTSIKNKNNIEAEKLGSRALYMISEQFVFDNLVSLKKTFSIADIYFDLDDAGIRSDAMPTLDNLVNLMMENPGLNVAITAYSDSRMSKYNEKLALNRAKAATEYLISKGISSDRILIEKHGRPTMANPCNNDPSCSLAVQQLNRKTEFNIVYNGVNLGQTN